MKRCGKVWARAAASFSIVTVLVLVLAAVPVFVSETQAGLLWNVRVHRAAGGTHEALMALGGRYVRLFNLQAEGYR